MDFSHQIYQHLIPNPNQCFHLQSVQMPGKLYIAGEYAVLEPGYPAIIVALDQYLTCQISLSSNPLEGKLLSDLPALDPLSYQRDLLTSKQIDWLDMASSGWSYTLTAIKVVEKLLLELRRPLQCFNLHIHSQLANQTGNKYGLGSSGAVVLAVIKALLQFYGYQVSPQILYKLGVLALRNLDHHGSWGDLAAIANGGITYYSRPDTKWLDQVADEPVSQLLVTEWPLLEITSLPQPNELQLLVAWTQAPASTDRLIQAAQKAPPQKELAQQSTTQEVDIQQKAMQKDAVRGISIQKDTLLQNITQEDIVQQGKTQHGGASISNSQTTSQLPTDFLNQARQLVNQMAASFKTGHILEIQTYLADYRHLLNQFATRRELIIETPRLSQLIHLAQTHQFEAKASGAGGGDCGIAIGSKQQDSQSLTKSWLAHDIVPLDLAISPTYTIERSPLSDTPTPTS